MSYLDIARSVDDVLRLLERCIETARAENSAEGYFPLLYSWETRDIAAAADDGVFDAPDDLRRMIVAFANRYFAARQRFRAGEPAPKAWGLSFRAARASPALVVQHLLLAMNAHINVDLAAAAAETGLSWSDFSRVDAILARGVRRVQGRLNRTTLVLRVMDMVAGEFDEMLTIFSLKAARRHAFEVAQRLRAAPEAERPALIAEAEDCALRIGQRLLQPPLRDRLLLAAVRLTERNMSPRRFLELLDAPGGDERPWSSPGGPSARRSPFVDASSRSAAGRARAGTEEVRAEQERERPAPR
ncbi:uncharacterized protein SOCEGT47_005330 [Sorangium cellulosum]|uniref:Uncharacterized protein n=1 Tax=Sorangium cellulosum TaxID=56 RepID=A0A4P2PU35_SORCE|nr:DUF5995 family protein [Sorangium cellulosum]AUX20070.1 uncharacterized protein SOCEGT47_005330 [Sorangium cellulosum]